MRLRWIELRKGTVNMLPGKELLQSSQKWVTILHIAIIHLQMVKEGRD